MSLPPTLESERLSLRAFVPDDLEASFKLWNDPAVYAGISGTPSSKETCWLRLLRGSGSWQLVGYGYWALCDKKNGHYIGEVGIANFGRNLTPELPCSPEAGWVLSPSEHGKGYATHAMQLVYAWFDKAMPRCTSTYCIIAPDNAASIKVAQKLGFVEVEGCSYEDRPVTRWERKRPDTP